MATDYKRRASPPPQKKPTPCWVWFSAGVMLGAFGCGLAWLKLGPRTQLQAQQVPGLQTPAQQSARQKHARNQEPKAPPPRFDFYTILPEMEVVVPDAKPATPNPAPAKREKPGNVDKRPPATQESYVVQAGAFSKRADAERLRASLALIGVEANIQSVTINNRDTVFRVRSGPYHSRGKLDDVRANLKRNGISSIAIKLQG